MSRRSGGGDLGIGVVIAAGFVVASCAGFAAGALTGPAAATPEATPLAASAPGSAPVTAVSPTAGPAVVPHAAMLDDSLQAGSETLIEGQSPRAEAVDGIGIVNSVKTDDPVFFITIDDGLVHSREVAEIIERYQIPVTAFLTEYAVRDATEYFKAVTAYGGSVQNHTMVHGALDDPKTDAEWEICETQDRFEQQFGYRPWMLRPPYGAGAADAKVLQYAEQCGINRIVLWNVVVTDDNRVEYWDPPIRPGDIVLLHWVDNLGEGLQKVLDLGEAQGLRPAPLEDYL